MTGLPTEREAAVAGLLMLSDPMCGTQCVQTKLSIATAAFAAGALPFLMRKKDNAS